MRFLALATAVISAVAACSCSGGDAPQKESARTEGSQEFLGSLLDDFNGEEVYRERLPAMPDDECEPLRTRNFPVYFGKMFADSNYIHLDVARRIGVETIGSPREAWHVRRPMVKITSCAEYYVDTLTHSLPYLVPEAADLVHDLGRRFVDSLAARGGGEYRIRLTSLLRTGVTVKRLRRVNINASENSAHCHGTTFDVAYNKFICDGTNHPRTAVDLKNLLGEIIEDLRNEGRCYVKYERKQGCFHITARPLID